MTPERTTRWRGVLALLLLALASGCIPKVKGVGLRDVNVDAPSAFLGTDGVEAPLEAARASSIFEDPHLVALVEAALDRNQELELLRQEMLIADAEIGGRLGEVFPHVGLGVGAGVEKVGRYTSQGAADASSEMTPGREVPEHLPNLRIALEASWEIDIWQKLTNATRAARARALASVEARNFAVTLLVSEVADAYYELLALDSQMAVVDTNIGLLEDALRIVRLQRDAAETTALGVQRFEAALLENQARRYDIQQRIIETENHVNLLCGRYPQSVPRREGTLLDVPLDPVDAGAPAQLLARRPDIRQAELGLEAAKLDVKVARAGFFPALSLDAEVGIEAFTPGKLVALPASLLYNLAGQVLAPLVNRAELKARWTAANAQQMQAVIAYERTALEAFVEVANDLARIQNLDAGYALQGQRVAVLEQAIETSNQLFRAARADYLEVLTTRREALEAQMELIETKRDQVAARIALYRAVGGGWTAAEAMTETTPASPKDGGP